MTSGARTRAKGPESAPRRVGWERRSRDCEGRDEAWDWNEGLRVRPMGVAGRWTSIQGLVLETYLELCPFSEGRVRLR